MFSFLITVQRFGFGVVLKAIEVKEEKEWNSQEIYETANEVVKLVSCLSVSLSTLTLCELACGGNNVAFNYWIVFAIHANFSRTIPLSILRSVI